MGDFILYIPAFCSEHIAGELLLAMCSVSVCVPFPITAPFLEILYACERVHAFIGGDLQVLKTLLEKTEDCHQQSDHTKRCRRTTSERASRETPAIDKS